MNDQKWLPTAENVNTLPEPVRMYIHDLETRCDPAGDIAALAFARDQVRQLEASNAALRAQGQSAEWVMTDELFRLLESTLQYYGEWSDARLGARTGGVVAGCPRGAPYIDRGEYADKAQIALQAWAAKCRTSQQGQSEAGQVDCSSSSDGGQVNPRRQCMDADKPASRQERRKGNPEDVGSNAPAYCNEPAAPAGPGEGADERRKDTSLYTTECSECPSGDCSDCPRKYGAEPKPDRRKAQPDAPVAEPVAAGYVTAIDWKPHQSEQMVKITRKAQPEYGFDKPLFLAPHRPEAAGVRQGLELAAALVQGTTELFGGDGSRKLRQRPEGDLMGSAYITELKRLAALPDADLLSRLEPK